MEDAEAAARAQFEKLGMAETAERNGVLIYVAPSSQKFAVIGDQAIHEHCGPASGATWPAPCRTTSAQGLFTDGLVKGVTRTGQALAEKFPRSDSPDHNELADEVSED